MKLEPERPLPGAANLGMARPPIIYLGSIVLGGLLHVAWPVHVLPRAAGWGLGAVLILLAVGLFRLADGKFRAAGTPVPGNQPTTAIVRTGPYRFSRNPIYLAFSLLHLGIALAVNSAWLLLTLLAAVAVIALVVIPREERYLEARFPSEYSAYKASVRRWI